MDFYWTFTITSYKWKLIQMPLFLQSVSLLPLNPFPHFIKFLPHPLFEQLGL